MNVHPEVTINLHVEKNPLPGIEYLIRKNREADPTLLFAGKGPFLLAPREWTVPVYDTEAYDGMVAHQVKRVRSYGYTEEKTKWLDKVLDELFFNAWKHVPEARAEGSMFKRWIVQGRKDQYVTQVTYPGKGFAALPALEHAIDRLRNPLAYLFETSGRGLPWLIDFSEMLGTSDRGRVFHVAYDLGKPTLREVAPRKL